MSAAVKEELKWFEGFACCRDRRGELYNSEAARKTGKMLAATFVHETSRAKDPSLHMHVLIANVTIDPERKKALAMNYGEMFEMRKTLDARIHNNLARRLGVLGTCKRPFCLQKISSLWGNLEAQRTFGLLNGASR
jgi:conjugative relaxase-like TrwC/TraI family protein